MAKNEVRVTHENAGLTFGKPINMRDDLSPLTDLIASIDQPILFFNVGCSEVNGDAYGPILGTLLKYSDLPDDVAVVGTEACYIGSVQLKNGAVERTAALYPDYICIATDAAIGDSGRVGNIQLKQGMLQPGAGCGKMLPPIGDYILTAAVIEDNNSTVSNIYDLVMCPRREVQALAEKTHTAIMAGLALRSQRLAEQKKEVVA